MQVIDNLSFQRRHQRRRGFRRSSSSPDDYTYHLQVVLPTLQTDTVPAPFTQKRYHQKPKRSREGQKQNRGKPTLHPPVALFEYFVLFDVQQFEIVTAPMKLRKGTLVEAVE